MHYPRQLKIICPGQKRNWYLQKKEIRGLQSQDYRFGFQVNVMKDIIAYCGVDCTLCDDYKNNSCPSCKASKWKKGDICMLVSIFEN